MILEEDFKAIAKLDEDAASSTPVQPIPRDELWQAIEDVKPGTYVNCGYWNDNSRFVAAAFKGGRGSEGNPRVQLFKATEVYGRCGVDYENVQAIKDKREAGIERSGNRYEIETELENKIYHVPGTGNDLLQIFPRSKSDIKARYYISIDGGDLEEISKQEASQYCVGGFTKSLGEFDPGRPLRFNLNGIYWFKDHGHSLLR